jgi:hypothetical protein
LDARDLRKRAGVILDLFGGLFLTATVQLT